MVSQRPATRGAVIAMAVQPTPAGRRLCDATAVGEGEAKGFPAQEDAPCLVIVARRDGCLHGWLDNCPHYAGGSPMAWRKDAYLDGSGEFLACHAHGALFDMASGECLMGPCAGEYLTPVPLRTDGDGVYLDQPIDWSGIER